MYRSDTQRILRKETNTAGTMEKVTSMTDKRERERELSLRDEGEDDVDDRQKERKGTNSAGRRRR